MTSKKELEKILDDCNTCADQGDESYYEHFLSCGQCNEYSKLAENFERKIMDLNELASKQESERKEEFGEWLRGIMALPHSDGKKELTDHLDLLAEVSEADREAMVKSRTDIFMSMRKDHRENLFQLMKEICKEWKVDRKTLELLATLNSCDDLPFIQKMIVRRRFGELLG